ncbi:hypothetical protein Tco_0389948 [Tanacetum coccineum]
MAKEAAFKSTRVVHANLQEDEEPEASREEKSAGSQILQYKDWLHLRTTKADFRGGTEVGGLRRQKETKGTKKVVSAWTLKKFNTGAERLILADCTAGEINGQREGKSPLLIAKLEANAELSSELQGEDFAKKMVDLVNQRKKFFAEERAKAKRNKPMTQSQLKTYMMNYLKNQGSWKLNQLRKLSFEEVKEEFDKLVKQIESFAPISFEATKDSLKRFGPTGTKAANVPRKKDSLIFNDNIITDDPNVALELGKSISKSKAKEQEEARRVHETHERLVTSVIIKDTPSVSKKQNTKSSMKLKCIEMLSVATQLEIDTKKSIKANKQVLDEPKDKLADSSEGTSTSPEDEEDDKSIDIQETDDERTEFDNDVVEMADKEEELKGDDQAKNEQEVGPATVTHKDKLVLLQSTSSHSVSSNFEITSLMYIEIQHVVPNIQQDPLHEVLVSVISTPATLPTPPPPITPPPATTTKDLIPPSSKSETLIAALQTLSIVE